MPERDERGFIRYTHEELMQIPSFEERTRAMGVRSSGAMRAAGAVTGGVLGGLGGAAVGSLFGPVGAATGAIAGGTAGGAAGTTVPPGQMQR